MEQRHHGADHVLLVISTAYLAAPYSNWERQAAQWASADKRPNFALPVFIEDCEAWTLLAHVKRCDLYGLSEIEARAALAAYLAPAEIPSAAVPFFGAAGPPGGANGAPGGTRVQPGSYYAVSNISIRVPRHFLGRDEDLAAIDTVLSGKHGHAIITTAFTDCAASVRPRLPQPMLGAVAVITARRGGSRLRRSRPCALTLLALPCGWDGSRRMKRKSRHLDQHWSDCAIKVRAFS
jgi:hypothetical protein